MRKNILLEAHHLVNGPRTKLYGHPLDDYERTTRTFNALTGHKLTAEDGVLFMICVKLSRQQNRFHRDNLTDISGYAACLEKIAEKRKAKHAKHR